VLRPGVRVGVDVGKVRIGVARCDPHAMLATPVMTVPRGDGDLAAIAELTAELEAIEVVVGLPLALSGARTASTDDAVGFAGKLAARLDVPVRLVDERLSTVTAGQALRASGRNSRTSRSVIDQVAAVIILQHALDFERSAGTPPGELADPDEGS
jgi:putative holliday junction resolvase